MKKSGGKAVRYNKWGYIFLIPFIVVYVIFQLIPLFSTIYNSFFENYMSGLTQVGPNFVGLQNYIKLFEGGDIWIYAKNTMILWIMCFVPQIFLSLLLGAWFSDVRLKLKGSRFFKTVIYLPNLIMASAFSMLFFTLFAESGPINSLLIQMGFITEPYKFLSNVGSTRGLIAFMNCLMWFGNTTILLMAGMMGIDTSLFEAAEVDGATSTQVFFRITLPLLRPILVYVLITSLIGGLQLFDVPQILTNGTGNPVRSTMTLIMFLNNHLYSKNYGMAGAVSVVLFIITGILSIVVFKLTGNDKRKGGFGMRKQEVKKGLGLHARRVIAYTVLIIISFFCLFWFYVLFINATRSNGELQAGFTAVPSTHLFDNWNNLLHGTLPVIKGLVNSLIISSLSAVLTVYFSTMTAYAIHAYDFRLKKYIYTFILAVMMIPTQVTALGFIRLMRSMNLMDSFIPLIVPAVAAPITFFYMKQYMESTLPLSLIEAARIDGSGEFRTFNSIVLPLMKPAIAVQAIFGFVSSWNNYFTPALILQSDNKKTLPILIAQLRAADWLKFDMGQVYVMIAFSIFPVIIVYLFLSRYIVQGIALGSVKG